MAELVVVPDQRVPGTSDLPNNWLSHDGTVKWTPDNRSNVTTITDSNGEASSSSINPGPNGSIYASSSGWSARVASSAEQDYRSNHYFGSTGGLSFGNLNSGQMVSGSNRSCWLRDVTGFFCQVSGAPTINNDYGSSGDSANDGCGKTKFFRIYGVYIDSNKNTHIYEMTKGRKVQSSFYTYTDWAPSAWTKFGYVLTNSDAEKVIDKKLMLGGWCLGVVHRKDCGGNKVSKNMTARLRYMTPIVTSRADNYSQQEFGYPWQIAMPPDTTADKATGGWNGSSPPPMYTK